MQFDLTPARDVKLEFPPTAEGYLRRIVFYIGAAIAGLCGLAVVASIGVAAAKIIGQLLHIH
ncbi:MAG: hypothetical protein WDN29_14780 [Methylovirgula sp.]